MKKLKFLLPVFILLLTNFSSYSQDIVTIKLKQPPPGRLNMADFWSFTLTNSTNENQKVYLKGSATEEKDGLIATGQTVSINLKPNEIKTMKVSDLPQTPDVNYVAKDGRYKESLIRQGKFPEGNYEICVSVLSANTNEELGNDCYRQSVQETGMITLISPSDGEEILAGTNPTFTWTGKPGVSYELKIVEVKDGQTPDVAMNKNKEFFTKKEIKGTSFIYPVTGDKFEKGKMYAWRISADNSKSEIYSFWEKIDNESDEREYLIINSDNPNLVYAYGRHRWYKSPFKKHVRLVTYNDYSINNKINQKDLEKIDYKNLTLQALDGEEMGLKFIHASSDSSYSSSSWILPNTNANKEDEFEDALAVHRKLKSFLHNIPKTECWNMPGGKFRLIDGSTGNEAVVVYEIQENGEYGFTIFENSTDESIFEKITLLDLESGELIMYSHRKTRSECDPFKHTWKKSRIK